jgi:predicted DNA-binding protein
MNKQPGAKYPETIHVRLSSAEKTRLDSLMNHLQTSKSEFIRMKIDKIVKSYPKNYERI